MKMVVFPVFHDSFEPGHQANPALVKKPILCNKVCILKTIYEITPNVLILGFISTPLPKHLFK